MIKVKTQTQPKKTKTVFTKDKGIFVFMIPAEESQKPFTLNDLLTTITIILIGISCGLFLGSYLLN